jgi:hypothetical protein
MVDFCLSKDDKIEVWLETLYVNNRRFAWTNNNGFIPVRRTPKDNLVARHTVRLDTEIDKEKICGHYVIGF